MNIILLDSPTTDSSGSILGSFFTADAGKVLAAGVLTPEQIMKRHGLTPKEYGAIENQVRKAKVLDALFSWPTGPRYDTLLYLVAASR